MQRTSPAGLTLLYSPLADPLTRTMQALAGIRSFPLVMPLYKLRHPCQPPRYYIRPFSKNVRHNLHAADRPGFQSIVDNPPVLVRSGRKHGPGLIILGITPALRDPNYDPYG